MGLSISRDSWILNIFRNNKERNQKTADYLDQIAEEASGVVKVWENVVNSVLTEGIAEAEGNTTWIRLVERPEWTIYSKNIPRSRIEIFYDKVSNVMGKSSRGEMDYMICKIGSMLQKRRLTQEIIEEELQRIKEPRFFDQNNRMTSNISLKDSVALLNREVEALNALAKEFRTKI